MPYLNNIIQIPNYFEISLSTPTMELHLFCLSRALPAPS